MSDLEKILQQFDQHAETIFDTKMSVMTNKRKVIGQEEASKIVADVLNNKPIGLEISKMLTVSTTHVTEATYKALLLDNMRNEIMLPIYVKCAGYGQSFGLYIYLEPTCIEQGKIPEDLMPLVKLAQENNCNILCLDGDGPELDGYQTYEWEN